MKNKFLDKKLLVKHRKLELNYLKMSFLHTNFFILQRPFFNGI
jgi:hypothetical protein